MSFFTHRVAVQRAPGQGAGRTRLPALAEALPGVGALLVATDGAARPARAPARDGVRARAARARPLQRPQRPRAHPRRRHHQVDEDRPLLRRPLRLLRPLHRPRHVRPVRVRPRPEPVEAGLPRQLRVREGSQQQRQPAVDGAV